MKKNTIAYLADLDCDMPLYGNINEDVEVGDLEVIDSKLDIIDVIEDGRRYIVNILTKGNEETMNMILERLPVELDEEELDLVKCDIISSRLYADSQYQSPKVSGLSVFEGYTGILREYGACTNMNERLIPLVDYIDGLEGQIGLNTAFNIILGMILALNRFYDNKSVMRGLSPSMMDLLIVSDDEDEIVTIFPRFNTLRYLKTIRSKPLPVNTLEFTDPVISGPVKSSSNIFGMACLMLYVLSGKICKFDDSDFREAYIEDEVIDVNITPLLDSDKEEDGIILFNSAYNIKKLIYDCLSKDVNKRPNIKQLYAKIVVCVDTLIEKLGDKYDKVVIKYDDPDVYNFMTYYEILEDIDEHIEEYRAMVSDGQFEGSLFSDIGPKLGQWKGSNSDSEFFEHGEQENLTIERIKSDYGASSSFSDNVFRAIKHANHDNILRCDDIYLHRQKVHIICEPMCDDISVIFKAVCSCANGPLLLGDRFVIANELRDKFLTDICFGLSYLHQNQVIHRGLSADNVLTNVSKYSNAAEYGDCTAKLSEFGRHKIDIPNDSSTIQFMDLAEVPPEFLLNLPYTTATDVFSFGILALYTLLGVKLKHCTLSQLKSDYISNLSQIEQNERYWDLCYMKGNMIAEARLKGYVGYVPKYVPDVYLEDGEVRLVSNNNRLGPKCPIFKVNEEFRKLILKCLSLQQKNRPTISDILDFFKNHKSTIRICHDDVI